MIDRIRKALLDEWHAALKKADVCGPNSRLATDVYIDARHRIDGVIYRVTAPAVAACVVASDALDFGDATEHVKDLAKIYGHNVKWYVAGLIGEEYHQEEVDRGA